MPTTKNLTIKGLDHSGEGTTVSVNLGTVSAANFDARVTSALGVQDAIQAISLIDFEGYDLIGSQVAREATKSAAQGAQREIKWSVKCVDASNNVFRFEIGGADMSLLDATGAYLDTSGGAGATFVSTVEGNVVSPYDGSAVTVEEVKLVGRNV